MKAPMKPSSAARLPVLSGALVASVGRRAPYLVSVPPEAQRLQPAWFAGAQTPRPGDTRAEAASR